MKLRAENIQKSYKGRRVVKGVSIEVNQGEIVGLLGPNGAGKTTSFYMIVGLVKPNAGSVFLDDTEITRHAMYKRAQMGIGYLPQEVSVFRKMSIEDNIMAVLEMTKLSKHEREEKLESLISEFGLGHVRTNLGQSLSGGEKRRTEIARALATDPKFILLDEPFAGVDPIAVEDIQIIVAKLKQRNIGVLITDHNVQETLSITDRTYLLFEGAILKAGTAEELAADEQVRKVYLGKNFVLRKVDVLAEEKEEENEKEDRIKSDDERNVDYAGNVLNVAKKVQNKLNSRSMFQVDPGLTEYAELQKLHESVLGFKTYFENMSLGKMAQSKFDFIHFAEPKKYHRSIFGNGLDYAFAYAIPIFGWGYWIYYAFGFKKCKSDLRLLINNLESFKHLLENPEMENMINE
jgi:lipopolysaccharide export system ATP-binding protein